MQALETQKKGSANIGKTGAVDALEVIMSGRELAKEDLKCTQTPTCPQLKSNHTITPLKTVLKESTMNPYLYKLFSGDTGTWDMSAMCCVSSPRLGSGYASKR